MEIETRRCSHHSRMVNEAPRRRPRGSMVSTCTSTNKVLGGSAGKPVKSELQQQAAQLASHGSLWLVSQTEATILSTVPVVITLLGWLIAIRGAALLALSPHATTQVSIASGPCRQCGQLNAPPDQML